MSFFFFLSKNFFVEMQACKFAFCHFVLRERVNSKKFERQRMDVERGKADLAYIMH